MTTKRLFHIQKKSGLRDLINSHNGISAKPNKTPGRGNSCRIRSWKLTHLQKGRNSQHCARTSSDFKRRKSSPPHSTSKESISLCLLTHTPPPVKTLSSSGVNNDQQQRNVMEITSKRNKKMTLCIRQKHEIAPQFNQDLDRRRSKFQKWRKPRNFGTSFDTKKRCNVDSRLEDIVLSSRRSDTLQELILTKRIHECMILRQSVGDVEKTGKLSTVTLITYPNRWTTHKSLTFSSMKRTPVKRSIVLSARGDRANPPSGNKVEP